MQVRTSRSSRRNSVMFVMVSPSMTNISVLTQRQLWLTSEGSTTISNKGDWEQQQHKTFLQRGKQSLEWYFPGKKEKTTNLVTEKSSFKPLTKERDDAQMLSSPLRFTLTSVMFSYIFSCRKRTKYNWDEKASQTRRKKERVRNQEQFSEVTSAIRLSQTWCSHSLLLTSVVAVTKFRRKNVFACMHTLPFLVRKGCCN